MQQVSRDPTLVSKQNSRALLSKVHNNSLPLTVHQLPAFLPHNPISIFRFAYAILSPFIKSSSSHPEPLLTAYFCEDTRSIHVTDSLSIQSLWNSGFFGKGSLSRSEPTWIHREQQRLGLSNKDASENVTRRRREERREFKRDRARRERQNVEEKEKIDLSYAADQVKPTESSLPEAQTREIEGSADQIHPYHRHLDKSVRGPSSSVEFNYTHTVSNPDISDMRKISHEKRSFSANHIKEEKLKVTQEYLQLTLQEGLFLVYGLGILSIRCPLTDMPLGAEELLLRCCSRSTDIKTRLQHLEPDDPFLLNYVVYHHFRSLGWVVRSGIKFSVDYLLYNRGPPFAHAEFAVNIIPTYWHSSRTKNDLRNEKTIHRSAKTWHWLHCINRVQSQVLKTLIFVYVDVPPPSTDTKSLSNIVELLEKYKIKEFIWRRWAPNRNRD